METICLHFMVNIALIGGFYFSPSGVEKKEDAQGVLNRGNLFLKIQACYWIISSAHQGLMTKRYYLAIRGSHELWLVTDHLISHALAI